MGPIPSHPLHLILPDATSSAPTMSLSANTIVGICIIAAIFACVILASVIKLCTKEAGLENTENLYKPYDPHQIERLHEVRRLGNMMAWERGRWAKLELIKQGRRMTVGYDDAMESLSTLEGQVRHQ